MVAMMAILVVTVVTEGRWYNSKKEVHLVLYFRSLSVLSVPGDAVVFDPEPACTMLFGPVITTYYNR